jgi:hypothetical protein
MAEHRVPKIADREGDYRAKMRQRIISPPRYDPFADGRFAFYRRSFSSNVKIDLALTKNDT